MMSENDLTRERIVRAAIEIADADGLSELTMRGVAGSGAYPTFVKVVDELAGGFDLDLDRLFEFGLKPLLDGLAPVIDGDRPGGPGSPGGPA